MPLRPRPARWFEVVVPRTDTHDALESLARLGNVQFEWRGERPAAKTLARLDEPLARYRELSGTHGRHWPQPVYRKRCCTLPLEEAARASVRQMEHWLEQAQPALQRLDAVTTALGELSRWRDVVRALGEKSVDLDRIMQSAPPLGGYCLIFPPSTESAPVDDRELVIDLVLEDGHQARIGLTSADRLAELVERARAHGGLRLTIPGGLDDPPGMRLDDLDRIEWDRSRESQRIEEDLRELAAQRGLDHARGTLERIAWFRDTAAGLECAGDYCWITGWTATAEADAMTRALRESGVKADVVLAPPPEDAALPSLTEHPFWLRPFEALTRAVGVPGLGEADPTTWIAMLVPLIFGYMCGDVGHGLAIAATGLLLIRHTRHWPLLVWCGLASTGFGFVFGDVFGYEHLVDPLWLHPMDDPLLVVLVPVAGGALVLTLGVVLHTVQTCWRGDGVSHGVADAGQLLVYWGFLLVIVEPRAGWLIPAGVLLCAVNRLLHDPSPVKLAAGLAALLESTFSLLLNTLSFARIGAFALAHAALESVIVGSAQRSESLAVTALVLVIGNLVVIVLESLVVSIQTSRLVLYEFLTRFFEGRGRAFEPAGRPPGHDHRA
jgi:V/A-type H+-transporting ATPase subunit I